jgi:hypothetical protein
MGTQYSKRTVSGMKRQVNLAGLPLMQDCRMPSWQSSILQNTSAHAAFSNLV